MGTLREEILQLEAERSDNRRWHAAGETSEQDPAIISDADAQAVFAIVMRRALR
jgi:hypothetical protein